MNCILTQQSYALVEISLESLKGVCMVGYYKKKYNCMSYYLKKKKLVTLKIRLIWKHWLTYSFMFILIRYIKTLFKTIKFYINQFEKWGKLDSCCENLTHVLLPLEKNSINKYFRRKI